MILYLSQLSSEESSSSEEDYTNPVMGGAGGKLPPDWMKKGGKIWEQAVAFFVEQQLEHGTSSTNSVYSPYIGKTQTLKVEFVEKCHELKKEAESKMKGPVTGSHR